MVVRFQKGDEPVEFVVSVLGEGHAPVVEAARFPHPATEHVHLVVAAVEPDAIEEGFHGGSLPFQHLHEVPVAVTKQARNVAAVVPGQRGLHEVGQLLLVKHVHGLAAIEQVVYARRLKWLGLLGQLRYVGSERRTGGGLRVRGQGNGPFEGVPLTGQVRGGQRGLRQRAAGGTAQLIKQCSVVIPTCGVAGAITSVAPAATAAESWSRWVIEQSLQRQPVQ